MADMMCGECSDELPERSPRCRKRLQLAMVVDDDARSRSLMTAGLAPWAREVTCASGVQSARQQLAIMRPELLVLDFALGDGDAFDVIERVSFLTPQPAVLVVSGEANVAQSFALAQCGVRSYLQKPFTAAALDAAIERTLTQCLDLRPSVCAAVGVRAMHDVEAEIRRTMLSEALARAGGNRRGAARLLSISRQSLQHMLRSAPELAVVPQRGARDTSNF